MEHGFQNSIKDTWNVLVRMCNIICTVYVVAEYHQHVIIWGTISTYYSAWWWQCFECSNIEFWVDDPLDIPWGYTRLVLSKKQLLFFCCFGHPPLPIGSMYAIYGNMDPINIPQMLAYIPAPAGSVMGWGIPPKKTSRESKWGRLFTLFHPYASSDQLIAWARCSSAASVFSEVTRLRQPPLKWLEYSIKNSIPMVYPIRNIHLKLGISMEI